MKAATGMLVQCFVWHEGERRLVKIISKLAGGHPLSKVFQYMPLGHRLPGFGKHLVPMFDLHGPTLGAQYYGANEFIATHAIIIHHGNEQCSLTDLLVWDVEDEGFVKHRIQVSFLDRCLFLFHFLAIVAHPDLHIGVCKQIKQQ